MAETLPKIWYSRILQSTDVTVFMNYVINSDRLDYKRDFQAFRPVDRQAAPSRLVLEHGRDPIANCCKDAFQITDGLLVISPKLRDVLIQFDLGKTRLFEVPIYESDGETLSGYPPHYILHIAELKDCFVPEESDNVRQFVQIFATEPEAGAPWIADVRTDRIAVRAGAAEGVDLWGDPVLRERIFLSDRLKRAIDAAGVTQKGLEPIAAKVLP